MSEKSKAVKDTVFKYDTAVADNITIEMPIGAEVLCVQLQGGGPKIWARVDGAAPTELRRFHWRGTGHPTDDCGCYIGTIQVLEGALIFHLFEEA